jgi:hypothetical protein
LVRETNKMKKTLLALIIVFAVILFISPLISMAQEGEGGEGGGPEAPPGCDYCDVPFDGGVAFFIFFSGGLGIYKIRKDSLKLEIAE